MPKQSNIPNLRDWPDKRIVMPNGQHLQEAVDAIRALSSGHADVPLYPSGGLARFPAIIASTGPNGNEADYTDERYWVQPVYIASGQQTDELTFKQDTAHPLGKAVTASNLPEQGLHSHFLDVGQYVMVEGFPDYSNPRNIRWFMIQEPIRWRHVRVIGYEVGNGKYTALTLDGTKFTAVDPTVDFQYPDNSDNFGVNSSSTVLLENLMESLCHSKMLNVGCVVLAYKWGFTTDSPPRRLYRCQVGGPGYAFFVNCVSDGGAGGTSTAAATYTYTIYPGHRNLAGPGEPTNDPALGTALAPVCRTANPTGRAGNQGIAAYFETGQPQATAGVTLRLIWVNEDDPNL